jgi:plasmid stability protein
MSVMVQIRNMPDEMHRILKSRAAAQGMFLSDYLLQELGKSAEVPTIQEWLERVRSREPIEMDISAEEAVRAERDSR